MSSTSTPKSVEPHDGPVAPGDERLVKAHEQITRAAEQLARLEEQVAKMERDAARPPLIGPGPQSPLKRPATLAALVGLSLASFIVVTALALQLSYDGGAKPVVAHLAPQLASNPSLPAEDAPLPAQAAPSIAGVAAAEAAPQQAAPSAQTAPQEAAPTATGAIPDHSQLLQTIARDLANLERSIEQLKATQQQTASENAKEIAELKASQEEIRRALAKVSEQNQSKVSSPPTQPAPALRKPERTAQPPRARARPRIRREWIYDDDYW
jgi:hypothetical protein